MSEPISDSEVIARICAMPIEFRSRGDISMVQLFIESGFAAHSGGVTLDSIACHLDVRQELITAWAMESEDQRCDGGAYFDESRCRVGYYESGSPALSWDRAFPNRATACAFYILIEMSILAEIVRE